MNTTFSIDIDSAQRKSTFSRSKIHNKIKSRMILPNARQLLKKKKFTKYLNVDNINTMTLPVFHIDLTSTYIIFDYNGTLVNKDTKKIRPCVSQLNLLKENGFKIGIWTNVQLKNIDLNKIKHDCNVTFDLILHQIHCDQPTDAERKDHHLSSEYDLMKNPLKFFDIENVLIVDDTPYKIPDIARKCVIPISTWLDDEDDREIEEIVHQIMFMFTTKPRK